MCESVGEAEMLSDNFVSKQSREAVSPGGFCSLAIHLLVIPLLPSGRARSDVSC